MKYIRTKDGIMKVDNYLEECEKWQAVKHLTTKEKFLQGTRQADTIEELCDEFVVVCDNEAMVMNKHLTLKEIIKSVNYYEEQDNIKIYGAIWTDKGLIYVAKIDSDGKLVLI